jgi:acetyl esterase/lipase
LTTVRAVALAVVVLAVTPGAASAQTGVYNDIQYGVANGKPLLLDAYVPPTPAPAGGRPAVVMIHGGGWRTGDKASWAEEANRLAERGWVAFSVNYRLDEPSMFPAEVEDVQTAVRWVRSRAAEYRVDTKRIGALGESAGGHLTAMLATLGEGSQETGARIRVGVAWSGPMDLAELARLRGDGWGVPLLGCSLAACPDRFAQASPITHVDGSDAPLFLVNSTDELVPKSQAVAMATRIEDKGAVTQLQTLPGTRHALDYRDEVWPQTELFLEKYLGGKDDGTSPGTIAFAVTVGVMLVGAAVAALVWRRRRRRAGRDRVPLAA